MENERISSVFCTYLYALILPSKYSLPESRIAYTAISNMKQDFIITSNSDRYFGFNSKQAPLDTFNVSELNNINCHKY